MKKVILLLLFLFIYTKSFCQDQESRLLELYYGIKTEIATKNYTELGEVPAAVYVITEDDIKKSGARDLIDVLNLLPSIQVLMSNMAGIPVVQMRGIGTDGSEKVLFAIDGNPVLQELTGGATFFFADMPVSAIKRVELLRGSGSYMYGANALIGVINIVTKNYDDIVKNSFELKYGTFDNKSLYFETSKDLKNLKVWSTINYYDTNGPDVYVPKDVLSYGKKENQLISRAPGNTNENIRRTDITFGADFGKIKLTGMYIDKVTGGFFNPTHAINDRTEVTRKFSSLYLDYTDDFLNKLIDLELDLIFRRFEMEADVHLYPKGYISPNGVYYLAGMRSIQVCTIDDFIVNLSNNLNLDVHKFNLSFSLKNSKLYDISHYATYTPLPASKLLNVTKTLNWIEPADRFSVGINLSDEWKIDKKTKLYLGLRYDNFDDQSGENLSPYFSLMRDILDNYKLKLVYTEAFRAPSFREIYKLPAGTPKVGNKKVKPEKVDTYQIGLEKITKNYTTTIYTYFMDFDDLLIEKFDSSKRLSYFKNTGKLTAKGIEFTHLHYFYHRHLQKIFFNLLYSQTEDEDGHDYVASPHWIVSGGFEIKLTKDLFLHLNSKYFGSSHRASWDKKEKFPSFWLTNIAINKHNFIHKDVTFRVGIYNLFDVDYAFPEVTGALPQNYTRPGINLEFSLTYNF